MNKLAKFLGSFNNIDLSLIPSKKYAEYVDGEIKDDISIEEFNTSININKFLWDLLHLGSILGVDNTVENKVFYIITLKNLVFSVMVFVDKDDKLNCSITEAPDNLRIVVLFDGEVISLCKDMLEVRKVINTHLIDNYDFEDIFESPTDFMRNHYALKASFEGDD